MRSIPVKTKQDFIENFKSGRYNKDLGLELFLIDLDSIIYESKKEYEDELVEVELDLEKCCDERAKLEEELFFMENK